LTWFIAIESRKTSNFLFEILKDNKRTKEFVFSNYIMQVHIYNALRLNILESEISKHSMYGIPQRNEQIERKIEEIKEEISRLRTSCYELESEEEQEQRKRNILNGL